DSRGAGSGRTGPQANHGQRPPEGYRRQRLIRRRRAPRLLHALPLPPTQLRPPESGGRRTIGAPISAIVMGVDPADLTGYPCALHDDSAGGGKRAVDGSGTRGFRDGASHQCDLGIIGANTIRLRRSRPAVPDAFEELLVPFSPRPHHRNSFDWSV